MRVWQGRIADCVRFPSTVKFQGVISLKESPKFSARAGNMEQVANMPATHGQQQTYLLENLLGKPLGLPYQSVVNVTAVLIIMVFDEVDCLRQTTAYMYITMLTVQLLEGSEKN